MFEVIEPELILKMKTMLLPDLINLLWSVLEINKGSKLFYSKLEDELSVRIRQVKDEDFKTLVECLSEAKSKFSDKFLEIIVHVIREKKDRF